jgi:hypothetical protein
MYLWHGTKPVSGILFQKFSQTTEIANVDLLQGFATKHLLASATRDCLITLRFTAYSS